MPPTDIIARISEWLESLWSDPAAAAEFAESPATSLANFDLAQSDLDGVDLRSVAGGVGGSGGVSSDGRQVLTQFSQSSPPVQHVTPVQEVALVTREIHHDNPTITKIFQDNSVNIDNSQSFINNGIVNGDVTFDNDVTVASGQGAVALGEGAEGVIASGAGSTAAGDDVTQAGAGAQVIQDSEVGNANNNSDGAILADEVNGANTGIIDDSVLAGGDVEDTVNGDDNVQVNPDAENRPEDEQDGEQDGRQDGEQDGRQENRSEDEQSGEDKGGEGDSPAEGDLPFGQGDQGAGQDGQQGQPGDVPTPDGQLANIPGTLEPGEEFGAAGDGDAPDPAAARDPQTDPAQGEDPTAGTDPTAADGPPPGETAPADLPESPAVPEAPEIPVTEDGTNDDQLLDA